MSFWKLKLIKIYLRIAMVQEGFNDLGLLEIEKQLYKSLELSDIIDELANKNARRVQF
jgi:hypothetical protein